MPKHLNELAPNPREINPDITEDLAEIIMRMIVKKPEDRYADYGTLKADIIEVKARIDINNTTELKRKYIVKDEQQAKFLSYHY